METRRFSSAYLSDSEIISFAKFYSQSGFLKIKKISQKLWIVLQLKEKKLIFFTFAESVNSCFFWIFMFIYLFILVLIMRDCNNTNIFFLFRLTGCFTTLYQSTCQTSWKNPPNIRRITRMWASSLPVSSTSTNSTTSPTWAARWWALAKYFVKGYYLDTLL